MFKAITFVSLLNTAQALECSPNLKPRDCSELDGHDITDPCKQECTRKVEFDGCMKECYDYANVITNETGKEAGDAHRD